MTTSTTIQQDENKKTLLITKYQATKAAKDILDTVIDNVEEEIPLKKKAAKKGKAGKKKPVVKSRVVRKDDY